MIYVMKRSNKIRLIRHYARKVAAVVGLLLFLVSVSAADGSVAVAAVGVAISAVIILFSNVDRIIAEEEKLDRYKKVIDALNRARHE